MLLDKGGIDARQRLCRRRSRIDVSTAFQLAARRRRKDKSTRSEFEAISDLRRTISDSASSITPCPSSLLILVRSPCTKRRHHMADNWSDVVVFNPNPRRRSGCFKGSRSGHNSAPPYMYEKLPGLRACARLGSLDRYGRKRRSAL